VAASYATDAGPLARSGIPSVVLGPGDITDAHTAAESVSVQQVETMQAVFESILAGR
jgi:acetylornithine deacetylase